MELRSNRPEILSQTDAMKSFQPVLILLIALTTGCEKNATQSTTIIVSGDTAGWIVPCGCTSNQSGGLPRRGTFVEQTRKQGAVVVVDVGGAASGTTLYDRLKFEAILRGENVMNVSVHNIGRREAALGIETLRQLRERFQTPWISANTTDREGNPLAEPARLIETESGRILFVGVLSQQFQDENVRTTPPGQAVLKTLKQNANKFDFVIVLAYVPEDELLELAESLPEVDAVVGGPTGQPVPPSRPQGHTTVLSATRQGKFLAVLSISPARKNAAKNNTTEIRGAIVELDERFEDDSAQLENVRTFYAELKRRDLLPKDTPFVDPVFAAGIEPIFTSERDTVVGSKSCQSCHEDEHRVWKTSRHAAAWQSLVRREAQYDPDCQRCHVTGYGWPGGFESVSKSMERLEVGCESCHGGSSEHCRQTSLKTSLATRAKDQCLRCHDAENSPRFDFDEYWPKIRHGNDFKN